MTFDFSCQISTEKNAKTNKSSSHDHWERDLYVRGLSTSTRIKDLQKHLLEVGNKA